MCTLVMLLRPGHAWPVLIAANRDEMRDRPWDPPARHWPDRAHVRAGRDVLAGGSWLGINDDGVVAGVLNRFNTLGPAEGKRSRGELVLEALDHATARDAASALADLDPEAYRGFNLVITDGLEAFWLRNAAMEAEALAQRPLAYVAMTAVPPGLHVLTALDLNDARDPRIKVQRSRLAAAPAPDPDDGDWFAWETLMASGDAPGEPHSALCFQWDSGFGTSSSALIALPAPTDAKRQPVFRFAPGPPASAPYQDIPM